MSDEADALRAESARIEGLLAEVRELAPFPAWQRVEQLLRSVVAMYAGGLSRALAHGRDAGANPAQLDELLCGDELLSSLLALHGLHPLTPEERIVRALAHCRSQLGVAEDELVLAGIRDGVAVVHATKALGGGAMSAGVAEGVIRRAVEGVAPEIESVELTGAVRPTEPPLVQIRMRREAPP